PWCVPQMGMPKVVILDVGAHISPVHTRSVQGHAAGDHAEMAERLGKIADETACRRIDLLRQQTEWTRPAAQRRIKTRRVVEPALFGQVLHEPEAAQEEGSLIAGNSIR